MTYRSDGPAASVVAAVMVIAGVSVAQPLAFAAAFAELEPAFTSVQAELLAVPNSYSNAWADDDNDGDLDIFAPNYGRNLLYRNNGNGTFTSASRSRSWAPPAADGSPSATFSQRDSMAKAR